MVVTIRVTRNFEWLCPCVLYEDVIFVCKDTITSAEGLALVQKHLAQIVEKYDLTPAWLKLHDLKPDMLHTYSEDEPLFFVWMFDDMRHRNLTGGQTSEQMKEITIELTVDGFSPVRAASNPYIRTA